MNFLREKIINIVKNQGFISLDEYIKFCLYNEDESYYRAKNVIGKNGDFITAPEISQIFGEIIAIFIIHKIQAITKNYYKINLIEMGGGNGTLADDILRTIKKFPEIYQKVNYNILDISEFLISKQKAKLRNYHEKINWIKNLSEIKNDGIAIIIANEFFDALPIKQFIYNDFRWFERVIKFNQAQDEFYFCKNEAKNPPENILKFSKIKKPRNDNIKEFCPDLSNFIKQISQIININNGLFLCFDYGYLQSDYGDSLQALYKNKFSNIFQNIGEADITAHIDFEYISEELKKHNISNIFTSTQGSFLTEMGALERAKSLQKGKSPQEQSEIFEAVSRLIAEDKMGALFKCLIAEKF